MRRPGVCSIKRWRRVRPTMAGLPVWWSGCFSDLSLPLPFCRAISHCSIEIVARRLQMVLASWMWELQLHVDKTKRRRTARYAARFMCLSFGSCVFIVTLASTISPSFPPRSRAFRRCDDTENTQGHFSFEFYVCVIVLAIIVAFTLRFRSVATLPRHVPPPSLDRSAALR